jgi:hypothetical protein
MLFKITTNLKQLKPIKLKGKNTIYTLIINKVHVIYCFIKQLNLVNYSFNKNS